MVPTTSPTECGRTGSTGNGSGGLGTAVSGPGSVPGAAVHGEGKPAPTGAAAKGDTMVGAGGPASLGKAGGTIRGLGAGAVSTPTWRRAASRLASTWLLPGSSSSARSKCWIDSPGDGATAANQLRNKAESPSLNKARRKLA
jgi:hypothetical protein